MLGGKTLSAEKKLVKAAIKGNDQAFLELIQLYKIELYKTALSFSRNEEEALEAIQEVTYRASNMHQNKVLLDFRDKTHALLRCLVPISIQQK